MNIDLSVTRFIVDQTAQTHYLENLCGQLDLFVSAQGGDRATAIRLIDRLRNQEHSGEDMIRVLATSLQIVVEREVAAQKACLQGIPSIFTDDFSRTLEPMSS